MKDKEKQIQKIKRIIDDRCEAELGQVHANSKDGKVTKTVDTSLIAKDIYKYLTENAVVLTQEDLKKYAKDCIIGELAGLDILNGLIARAERKEQLARKETAEKFYKKVRKLLKKVDIIVDGDEGLVGYEESAVDKVLKKTLKEFINETT